MKIWTFLFSAVLLLGTHTCLGNGVEDFEDEQEHLEEAIDSTLTDSVADGTSAVATYLGFNCPAGYRCLPVLECLPCDFGTYKSDTGSKLCTPCPTGCTTLRKGASTWRECVPMCPPGYEPSQWGKTCARCQPGSFKPTWLNGTCLQCPAGSSPDTVTLGMTSESECYAEDEDGSDASSSDSSNYESSSYDSSAYGENGCLAECLQYPSYTPLVGSNCTRFCQCDVTPEEGTYIYTAHDCAAGTRWFGGATVCEHLYNRNCIAEGLVGNPAIGSGNQNSDCKDICEQTVSSSASSQYRMIPGSDCQRFCACDSVNSQIHWQEITCDDGFIAGEDFFCRDSTTTTCTYQSWSSSSSSYDTSTLYSSSDGYSSYESTGWWDPSWSSYDISSSDSYSYDSSHYGSSGYGANGCPDYCSTSDTSQWYTVLVGSNCTGFCQCDVTATEGINTYTAHDCAPGTIWISGGTVCQNLYNRNCIAEGLVHDATLGSGNQNSECKDICGQTLIGSVTNQNWMIPGSDCKRFCACGYSAYSQISWQEITCDDGFIAGEDFICRDSTTTTCTYQNWQDWISSYSYGSSYGSSSFDSSGFNSGAWSSSWSSYESSTYSSLSYDYSSYDSTGYNGGTSAWSSSDSSFYDSSTYDSSGYASNDNGCPANCTQEEYEGQDLIPAADGDCDSYCQCENDLNNGTFTWTLKSCPIGTLPVVGDCLTSDDYNRFCFAEGFVGGASTSGVTSECEGICENIVPSTPYGIITYELVPNTGCTSVCACGWYRRTMTEIYWQQISCETGSVAVRIANDFICEQVATCTWK